MKNIVVGIDFSQNAYNAMRHAVAIAIKTKGIIHLVWVKTPGASQNVAKGNSQDYAKSAEKKLNELVKQCRAEAHSCEVHGIILEGKASAQLTTFTSNLSDATLVIGTHGISGFEELFVGSNTFRTINISKQPILILREGVDVNRDLINILAPVDNSFDTLQKMKHAIAYAQAFNAKLLLVGLMRNNKEDRHTVKVQLKHAISMCNEANIRYETNEIKVKGNVAEDLIKYAVSKEVNLMVIMRESDSSSDYFMGADTRQLINFAPMPMLVIPNVNHSAIAK
jgi:nucleotide-binding universal stress UspA family protein